MDLKVVDERVFSGGCSTRYLTKKVLIFVDMCISTFLVHSGLETKSYE